MSRTSRQECERLLNGTHAQPRSVLGFHVLKGEETGEQWLIRALEPGASGVSLCWDENPDQELPLSAIHPDGVFELRMPASGKARPYQLLVRWPDETIVRKVDAYYFAPVISEFDLHLFGTGQHHHIYNKLGAHLQLIEEVSGTHFAVWAPTAQRVSVVGNFNAWDGRRHPLQARGETGVWELFIPGCGPGEIYKYEIRTQAGEIVLKADPYAFAAELRPATGSVVADLSGHEWRDTDWMQSRAAADPLAAPINIYEVHPGSWKRIVDENEEEGERPFTWDELAQDLIPYVSDMGYTHIELMGVAEYPFDGSWGYQVTGYYAPTARHGSPQAFMRFVDACHAAGIGVVLDWVPAHFPRDSHGLAWFDGSSLYEHEDPRQGEHADWGTKVFNFGRPQVSNFLIANALYWLEVFHIDGLRVDAVASLLYLDYSRNEGEWVPNRYGGRENLEAIAFLRALNEAIFHYHPGVLSIAEESTAYPGVSRPVAEGGLGFNLKWNMGWMNDTLRYMETDPLFRKDQSQLLTFSMVYAYSENFVLPLSHDEFVHGKRALIEKMPGDEWRKRAQHRLYLGLQTAHPGKQLLFMGTEFGQWREWSEARSLDWHLLKDKGQRQLQRWTRKLNHFYRQHPALFGGDFDPAGFQWLVLHDDAASVYAFQRSDPAGREEPVIAVFNFTPVPRKGYLVPVPAAGHYTKVLDSDAIRFGGSGFNRARVARANANAEANGSAEPNAFNIQLDLPPLAMLLLQRRGSGA